METVAMLPVTRAMERTTDDSQNFSYPKPIIPKRYSGGELVRSTLKMGILVMLVIAGILTGIAAAAGTPDYTIAYTITIADDGSALWHVEYRTHLFSDTDLADFQVYTEELPTVYLPQFRTLMERSAAQAAATTGRHMAITGVTGDTAVQESPTGRYGVVIYTTRWDGFAQPGTTMTIGDAFAGGLYLEKDNTLVIRYPAGYTVVRAEPEPDATRDGLVWYGQHSFGAGEPRVVLEQPAIPLLPVAAGLLLVGVIAIAGFVFIRRRGKNQEDASDEIPAAIPLTGTELMSLEDRILQQLRTHGGELFQSEIVRITGLPRSTVSTVLNSLHERGSIVKIKKGRENLIRLAPDPPPETGT